MYPIKILLLCAFMLVGAQFSLAQDDLVLPLPYDPAEVLQEWRLWKTGQSPYAAYITGFMADHAVPQEGLYGLTLEETWYWWISTNQEKVEHYLSETRKTEP